MFTSLLLANLFKHLLLESSGLSIDLQVAWNKSKACSKSKARDVSDINSHKGSG